jgi:F0F1-type ATP synthase membrane subunit b/b'
MKLLAKSDLVKAKAFDRQREMDEGLKLAKRVDTLREVAAEEEASLAKFRTTTLSVIGDEIIAITNKRDVLKQEVKSLEGRKVIALTPLVDEWSKIVKIVNKKHAQSTLGEFLQAKDEEIREKEASLERRRKEIAQLDEKASYAQQRIRESIDNADTILKEAERKSILAEMVLEKARNQSSELIENAQKKSKEVKERERAVSQKDAELLEKETDLANREIALNDKYETLQRTIKRL